MSRRLVNPARGLADSANISFRKLLHSKSRPTPLLSIGLVLLGAIILVAYSYRSGWSGGNSDAVSKLQGAVSCTLEVLNTLPFLKKAYGDGMHKVLHVGPETCSVVSRFLKEEDIEAWGVEPYDMDDAADNECRGLIKRGIVRVADVKFPLPYRAKSFSLVVVSDALDYLSPRYLNKTLPELTRVSSGGLVVFAGFPVPQRAKAAGVSRFGRPAKMRSSSLWIRYFVQTSLEENESATKKFEQAAAKRSYKPACQVFHLKPYH